MAHLKLSATTGHLLRNAAGHLVLDCGCVSVCGCCYSVGTQFRFTMPPLKREATAGCGSPFPVYGPDLTAFLAWLNSRVFTSPALTATGFPDSAVNSTYTGESSEWTVTGSILWACDADKFYATVSLTASTPGDTGFIGEPKTAIHLNVRLEWTKENCCRATTGPDTFSDESEDWCGWVRNDTADYTFVVLGNVCCVDALGDCTNTGAATCGGTDTGECPEEPI